MIHIKYILEIKNILIKKIPPRTRSKGVNFYINYLGNLFIHILVLGVMPFQEDQSSPPLDM
jgi:hypothetical protein